MAAADGIGENESTYRLVIRIQRLLKGDCHFPLPLVSLDQITITKDQEVLLDTSKEAFLKMVKSYEVERKNKAKNAKMAEPRGENVAAALSIQGRW